MSFERRKTRIGKVVSDKMDKSVVVSIQWRQPTAVYRKPVRRRTNLTAHDNNNEYRTGDFVRVREGRPMSKTKRWRVIELVSREEITEMQPEQMAISDLVLEQESPESGQVASSGSQEQVVGDQGALGREEKASESEGDEDKKEAGEE
jgi:small subunit ribosomal protein S17